MALSKLLNRFSKSVLQDKDVLVKEIYPDILISKDQLETWEALYRKNKNPINHPYVEIAQIYTNAGLHEKAEKFYQLYLNKYNNKQIYGLYLQNALLSTTSTNQSLLKKHKDYAALYDKESLRSNWKNKFSKANKSKLKIGYVCHFFNNSISHNVMLPFLKLHDRNKFEVFCYDDGEASLSEKSNADHWRDIRNLSDKEVAGLIQRDGIDILHEANGFCIINRFGALAYRPAPIQINWYNHTGTTGLPYIDYVMSDAVSIQDDDLPHFVESAYRTPNFIAAIRFSSDKFGSTLEKISTSQKNTVTFGYFGGSHKITLTAIEAWSRILKSVPNSRLILKCGSFTHDIYRNIFTKHFLNYGVTEDQITFEGWSDQATTLRKYNEIDIMLDNIPVSGGSTMFEALIQGVPVVTLMGNRWAARSGASVLITLNHPELVAHSLDEYVNIAVKLANDPKLLMHYHSILRDEMLNSSLTSIEACYHNFEKAYLWMWQQWQQQ